MTLTYIYNSCFTLEGEGWNLLFDYYKDSGKEDNTGYVHDHFLKREGKLYVFSSHVHHDHFNKHILKWRELRPDITYILSRDILDRGRAKADDAIFIDKLESYQDETLKATAYGSTDAGVSFHIEIDGKSIFHAGDLNNWHWSDESTPEEIEQAESFWASELKIITENISHLDLAMFPVDNRMGTDYMRGAEQFIAAVPTTLFSPMHFQKDYKGAAAIRPFAESNGTAVVEWKMKGESYECNSALIKTT